MRKAELAFAFMLVLLTVGCDRVTKHLASVHLADQPARSYLADTIRLEYAENTGAFLSLGSGLSEPIRFGLFRLGVGLALLAIVIVALKRKWHGLLLAGVTLLFAGGISNLIDRLNLFSQALESTQVARRSDVVGRHRQDKLWLRRKPLLDLFGFLDPGVTG